MQDMGSYLKSPLNLALTETSFFGIASLGSAQCLLDCGRGVVDLVQCCGGVSSSALVAAVLLTAPDKTKDYLQELYHLVDAVSPLPYGAVTPDFDLIQRMRVILNNVLPINAHEKASTKLVVKGTELLLVDKYSPLTVHDVDQGSSSCLKTKGPKFFEVGEYCWQLGNEIEMTKFSTKEDLVEALLGSIYVPWFPSWSTPKFDGKFIGDITLSLRGSFPTETNFNFPDGQLIKISPGPRSHVTMRDKIAIGWIDTSGQRFDISALQMFRVGNGLFPPPKEFLETYFAEGYEDATRFLKFYHAYEDNQESLYKPRQMNYPNIHGIDDLK